MNRKRLSYWYPSEEKITKHSLEQAQIRFKQKEVLLRERIVKMWFMKPCGNPQKKISDWGSKAWRCSGLQNCSVLSVPLHWDRTCTWWLSKIRQFLKEKALSSAAKCHYKQTMARLCWWWKHKTISVPYDNTGSWLGFSTTSIMWWKFWGGWWRRETWELCSKYNTLAYRNTSRKDVVSRTRLFHQWKNMPQTIEPPVRQRNTVFL